MDLDTLESRVVEIGKVVSNITECSNKGQHHGAAGICQRSDAWSCEALSIANAAVSVKGEAFIGTVARVTCNGGFYLEHGESVVHCLASTPCP